MNFSKKLLTLVAVTSLIGSQLCADITEGNIPVEPVKVTKVKARIGLRAELKVLSEKFAPFVAAFKEKIEKTKKSANRETYKDLVEIVENMLKDAAKAKKLLKKDKLDVAVVVNQEFAGGTVVGVDAGETPNAKIDTNVMPGEGFEETKNNIVVVPVQPEGGDVVLVQEDALKKVMEEQKKTEEEQKATEAKLAEAEAEQKVTEEKLKAAEAEQDATEAKLAATEAQLEAAKVEVASEKVPTTEVKSRKSKSSRKKEVASAKRSGSGKRVAEQPAKKSKSRRSRTTAVTKVK